MLDFDSNSDFALTAVAEIIVFVVTAVVAVAVAVAVVIVAAAVVVVVVVVAAVAVAAVPVVGFPGNRRMDGWIVGRWCPAAFAVPVAKTAVEHFVDRKDR